MKNKKKLNNTEQTTLQSVSVEEPIAFSQNGMILNKNQQSQTEFGFTFQIDQQQILYIFEQVASQLEFDMIEKQENYATAIKSPKKGRFDFLKCLSFYSTPNVTAIKISIYSSWNNSKKFAIVKALIGSKIQTVQFLKKIKQKTKQLQTHQSYLISEKHKQVAQEPSNPFYIQICANYMFRQILSNQETKICQNLQKEIKDFIDSFKNLKQSADLLPIPMKNVITMINETHQIIIEQYQKNQQVNKVLAYCRISIESYIFQKLEKHIMPIYNIKNTDSNIIFERKRKKIFEQLNLKQILQEVSLSQKLWFVKQQSLDKKLTIKEACQEMNYKQVLQEMSKIGFTTNCREKIKYLELMYSRLKSIIFQKSNKKIQLFNMEDVIPNMILIILFSDLSNIRSEIDMMFDFIQFDPSDMEGQKRIVVNFSQSYNYIIRDWKI